MKVFSELSYFLAITYVFMHLQSAYFYLLHLSSQSNVCFQFTTMVLFHVFITLWLLNPHCIENKDAQ